MTATFGTIYVIFKKCVALISAIMLLVVGEEIEAEGMTVYADENGEPVFCVLDRGARRQNCNLTRYKLAD